MSILIKGIKMPKDGNYIFSFASDENGQNTLLLMAEYESFKLIEHGGVDEIPPHGRLIDADKLYKWIKAECNPYGKPTIGKEDGMKVIEIIKACHTVIEAEVEG